MKVTATMSSSFLALLSGIASRLSTRSIAAELCPEAHPAPGLGGRSPVRTTGSVLGAVAVLGLAFGAGKAGAQTLSLVGQQTQVGTLNGNPHQIVFDASGNLYVVDDTGTSGGVYKETYSGTPGVYTQTKIATATAPGSVALDPSGNVYVSTELGYIYEYVLSSSSSTGYAGATQVAFLPGVNLRGLAIDTSGNLFAANANTGGIYKFAVGTFTQTTVAAGGYTSNAYGLGIDASNNLYVGDTTNGRVAKFTLSSGTYSAATYPVTGFSDLQGVSPDASGNLYLGTASGVVEAVYSSSANTYTPKTIMPTTEQVAAVDASGNLFLLPYGQASVTEYGKTPSFGSVALGTAATQMPVVFYVQSGGTLGTPQVLTGGATGFDYTSGTAATVPCSGTVVSGTACTVNVAFTPKAAGTRLGGLSLVNASGAVVASAYVQGVGTGPQAVIYPGNETLPFGTNLNEPGGVAVDGSGNVYLAVYGGSVFYKETLSGGTYTQTSIGTVSSPFGAAVDGLGNVYIANYGGGNVLKETLSGGTYTQTTVGSNVGNPTGVAVDGSGNVYIATFYANLVYKETLSGGTYTQTSIGSGLKSPSGVAVDAAGNVYIADTFNNRVLKETLSAGVYTQSVIATGFSDPYGVAVDASGTVYVTDFGNGRLVKETLSGGTYTQSVLATSLNSPFGVTLDASGNVLVGTAGNTVYKFDVADTQTLTFATTNVGSTSASQTVTLANIGTAALTFPVPSVGTNPGISTGYVVGGASTCPQLTTSSYNAGTLAAGATCTDVLSFAPTAGGTASGQLVTTDTNLNASPSTTQLVKLTGTGVAVLPTVTSISPSTGLASGGTTVTITGTAFTGATAVSFGSVSATSFTVVSNTQITATAPAGTIGSVFVTVTNSAGTNATSTADSFTYTGPPTLTVTNSAAIAGGTAKLTATVSGTVTPTGGVSFTVNGGASVVGTCTAGTGSETCTASYPTTGLVAGSTYTITANFTADANFTAVSNTGTLTVVPNSFAAASTPVGSTSTGTATVVFASSTTLNSNLATAIQVVTQGITGLDFAYASGGSCAAGATYLAGASCTVQYTFTPRAPGARYGAVLLFNAATPATVAASAFLQGVGTGPQANITPGVISTFAGAGAACSGTATCGDGGQAKAATTNQPTGVAIDAAGNLFIADTFSQRVRRVDAKTGIITTVAGTGAISTYCNGVDGDGGLATAATFSYPQTVTLDGAGNLYISDTSNQRIRKISAQTGIVSTVAGGVVAGNTCAASTGDGGVSTSASLNNPDGLAVDGAGNVYIAEIGGNRVRRIDAVTGIITTVVGNGTGTSTGDNGLASAATINGPAQMVFDATGDLFIAEYTGSRVRELLTTGKIVTVAGTGVATSTGDGGSATAATVIRPNGVAVDAAGDVYIAEEGSRIRQISASTGLIATVAGTGTAGFTGNGVSATQAGINVPEGVTLDGNGNLFIADTNNNRIREVMMTTSGALAFGSVAVGSTSADSPRTVTVFNAGQTAFTLTSGTVSSSNAFQIGANTCTTGSTLAGGSSCTAKVSFTPTAVGAQTGTVTIVDSTGVTHTFTVSGTGTQATPLVAVASLGISYGTGTANLAATVTFGANATPAGQFTFTVGTGAAVVATCTAATSTTELCTASYPTGALASSTSGSATYTITGSLAADATYFAASATGTLTVTPAVLLPVVANVSATAAGPAALSVTIPYSGVLPTGAVTFTVASNATVAATCTAGTGSEVCTASYPTAGLASGSNTITVSVGADSLYSSATATGTLTVVPGSYAASTTPVGTPSQTVTATLVFNAPVTLNPTLLTAIQVVTQGAPNLDFAYAPGGTCVAGASYTAGGSCTVDVIFTPKAPGARLGAVLLYDNSATPLLVSTAYLSGTGTSGLGLFEPATQTTVASGLMTARGPSVDALGNLYVSEQASGFGAIDKFAAGTGTRTVLASGLSGPGGTTVDGAGNVYFAVTDDGSGSGGVFELIGGTGTPVEIASGLSPDNILLSDGAGNVYVTDYNSDAIYEIAAGSHAVSTIFNGFGDRFIGLAMDAAGNFYGATFNGNTMYELPVGNYNAPITLFSGNGLSNPHGLAIDPAGNLYVTNYTGQANIVRYAAGTYAATTLAATGSRGIAIDGAGNLYTTDDGDLYAYNRANATLSFADTPVGATSGDSPLSLGFENDGNASLAVSALGTSSSNFTLDTTATTCATGAFASAATCNLGVDFTPVTAGTLTGTLNVTDNNLNLTGTIQTVALNGIGTQGTPTVAVAAATAVYGAPTTTLSATVTYPGSTAPTGVFTFTVGSGTAVTASCIAATSTTETCTVSYPTTSLTVNSYTITGSLAGDTNELPASMTGTLTVTQATPILSVANVTTSFSNGTATLTATLAYPGASAPTGSVTFSVGGTTVTAACAGTASPLTCTASLSLAGAALGANTISAGVAADTNYMAATATGTLDLTAATATVTVTNATAVYGTPTTTLTASVAYTGTTAPTGAFSFTVGSGPAAVASCTGTASPLTCTAVYTTSALAVNSYPVTGSLAADNRFAATPGTGTLTITQALPAVTVASQTISYGTATETLSATEVFPGSTAPTGAVAFTIDSGAAVTAVCSGTTSPRTCTASYPTAALTAGAHTIKASAAADANFSIATGTGTLTVTSTTPQVSVSSQSIAYGTATATLTANIAFTGAMPTGAVTFTIDTGAAVTATCSGTASPRTCTASYPTATLAVGAHTAKASFAADADYSASSGNGTVTVTATTPAVTVASVSASYGAATATLSANVTFTGTVPTSAVLFTVDNGTAVTASCTGTASPLTCTASYPVASLTAGAHTITATLAADSNYAAASGTGTLTLVVTNATISFALASHSYGDPAFTVAATSNSTGAFTYTVISGPGTVSGSTVTLTGIGTVILQASQAADANFVAGSKQASFTVSAATLTATAANASRVYGAANPAFTGTVAGAKYSDTFAETFTTAATASSPVGTYPIVPAVTGADLADYSATATNGTLTVTQAPTVASFTASAATLNPNQAVTFNAAVASTTTGTPTGTVTFFDNGTALSTVPLVNGGAAYTTTTLAPAATHSITIAYSGDVDFLASSTALGSPVTVGALDFTFATVGYNAYTVTPGKVATFNFALAPEFTTYAGTVTFAVTGLPAGATASFSPASVPANGGAQSVVMSIQTPQATAENKPGPLNPANPTNPMRRDWPVLALLLLPTLGSGRVRRKLGTRMLTLLLLVAGLGGATALTGCGTGTNGFLLQAPSTYSLTVTATSGTLQHSQTVTLTVQ